MTIAQTHYLGGHTEGDRLRQVYYVLMSGIRF